MYGVIGEAGSDAATLRVLIQQLLNNKAIAVKKKDYDGCGEILKRGSRQLQLFSDVGCTRFVICYDADGDDPGRKRRQIFEKVVEPSGCAHDHCCIVVPVQEIEAWILADIDHVAPLVATSWRPEAYQGDPERAQKPQRLLEKLSRDSKQRPRYAHAIHNEKVAAHLDLTRVRERCPSFRPFADFVTGKGKAGRSR